MKTSFQIGLLVVAFCLGLLGCNDDEVIHTTAVYTSRDTSQVYSLYVDGDLIGVVPTLSGPIASDSTARLADCLNFTLPDGRHKMELWDEAGAVVSGFRLTVNGGDYKTSSLAGVNGGAFVGADGTCIVIRMD